MLETERAIAAILEAKGDAEAAARAHRHCEAIERAFPEALVNGYEQLVPALNLPDEKDRHVLAAAVRAGADVIVTDNKRDFPDASIARFDIAASTADDFLADVIDLHRQGSVAALRTMRMRFKRPDLNAEALLRRMESAGLTQTANLLIGEIDSL